MGMIPTFFIPSYRYGGSRRTKWISRYTNCQWRNIGKRQPVAGRTRHWERDSRERHLGERLATGGDRPTTDFAVLVEDVDTVAVIRRRA